MPPAFVKGYMFVSRLALPLGIFLAYGSITAQPARKISFERDVAPILTQRCMNCHGKEPLMAHLDLRTRDGALKGAKHGPGVIPGNSAESHLYRRLTGQRQPPMPLGGRLSDEEIAIIKDWIEIGRASCRER